MCDYFGRNAKTNIIKVYGIEGARAYPVRPGCKLVLFDIMNDIFYLKSADAGGYATITVYRFEKEKGPE